MFPQLNPIPTTRQMVEAFRGYNHNLRIGTGEFYNMENLTSDQYPVLSPRKKRGLYANPASPQGITGKEQLCYVDGADFVMGNQRISMELSTSHEDCPKQLVSMGAYVLIFPDKKYINTADPADRGSMEAEFTTDGETVFSLCDAQGTPMTPRYTQPEAPQQPQNGEFWLDTAQTPGSLKQWSSSTQQWSGVLTTYVRISHPGIGADFRAWDGVTLSGLQQEQLLQFQKAAVIQSVGTDYLVLTGLLSEPVSTNLPVTVSRKLPRMDHVLECGNRLWGCRYGQDDSGEMVNRLYASKLGDFRNWSCFMGLSTDSYYANLGSDGPFTGAIAHLGQPLFFKENCLHKVFGSMPSDFTLQDTPCRGVQPGCHRSLAIVGDDLYYKSRSGVCLYDGSLPREVSQALGGVVYEDAVAGSHQSKYYISMHASDGWHLFVYDTLRGQWHREDSFHSGGFASYAGELYAIDATQNRIITMLGSGEPLEQRVNWMAQTGELGITGAEMKYISRITLRLQLEQEAKLEVYAQYDQSDEWQLLASICHCSLRSFSIPIRPRRSDFLRLRFVGQGNVRLYAMTKTIEKGSEIS